MTRKWASLLSTTIGLALEDWTSLGTLRSPIQLHSNNHRISLPITIQEGMGRSNESRRLVLSRSPRADRRLYLTPHLHLVRLLRRLCPPQYHLISRKWRLPLKLSITACVHHPHPPHVILLDISRNGSRIIQLRLPR